MPDERLEQEEKITYDEEEERRRREREKEKQEEKKKKAKPESKPIAKEETTVPEKVKIPIVELDKPAVELKEIEIDSEIPKITKEEVKIIIPVVELKKPSIELKRIELDCTLPSIIPEERRLAVPLIRLEKPKKVTCIITTFDERPPQVKVTKRMLKIPIYRPSKSVIREIISSFDSRLDAQILNLIIKRKEKEVIEEGQTAEVISPAGESSGGGKEEEMEYDILKHIFGISKNSLFSGNPKLVYVTNEEFLGAVRYICWRIYREIKGGKAEPKIISNASKEIFKREIENWMKAENRVFSVEFKKDEKLDKDFWESVVDRIEELFGQDIGFIVVNQKILFIPKHHIVDMLEINPNNLLAEKKLQAELCSIMWGFINPDLLLEETKKNFLGQSKFDYIFEVARKNFERKIKSIGEPYVSITKRHRGLNESDDMHYPIKVFVVKYIADILGLKGIRDVDKMRDIIHTEETFNRDKFGMDETTYPDIYVDSNAQHFADEVFEVETLFGEGEYSLKKIDETIEKYEKISNPPKRVNIVLENLTLLIHLKDIVEKKKIHEKLNRKFELEFWTLDIQNSKLLSLEEVIKKIKSWYMHASS